MIFRIYYLLASLQALWALVTLLRIPPDPKNAILLGYSAPRLALLAAVLAILGVFGWLAWRSLRDRPRHVEDVRRILLEHHRWGWLVLMGILMFAAGALVAGALQQRSLHLLAPPGDLPELEIEQYFTQLAFFRLEPALTRLLPLAVLGAGLGLQSVLLVPVMAMGWADWRARLGRQHLWTVAALFGAGMLAWLGLGGVALRIRPDVIGWNTIGGPLLETQVLGIGMLAAATLLIAPIVKRLRFAGLFKRRIPWDALLFVLIWLSAAVHWTSVPLSPSWYLAPPRAPNQEMYPNSDAAIYDLTGQNMLVGEGLKTAPFNPAVIRRPLLTFGIGLLHSLAGQDYAAVGNLQSALLALLPALVFLLARIYGSRLIGMLAAGLIILREGNTIALAGEITVSHSRLLLADLPSAMLAVLFLLAAHAWLSRMGAGRAWSLLLGAVLGAAIMVRVELIVFLPALAIAVFWQARRRWKDALPGLALAVVAIVLFIGPWMFRNWQRTGKLYIEVPNWRLAFYLDRLLNTETSFENRPSGAQLRPMLQEPEGAVPSLVLNHFLHSNLQAVLMFPDIVRAVDAAAGFSEHENPERFWDACCGRENYIQRLPFWQWRKWDMSLPTQTLLPIAATIFILAVGLVRTWKALGPAGLLPLLMFEFYVLINAAVRTSGGRYLLPVDWVWIFYYAVGLAFVARGFVLLVRPAAEPVFALSAGAPAARRENERPVWFLPALAGLILAAGAVIPLGERLYPVRYGPENGDRWLGEAVEQAPAIEALLENGGVALYGRALYPRAYGPGEGEQGTTFPSFYPQETARIAFQLAGPVSSGVVMAVDPGRGLVFPHAADVLVVGCRTSHLKGDHTRAAFIYLPETGRVLQGDVAASGPLSCPIP